MHQLKNYVTIESNFQFSFKSNKKVELTKEHIIYQWENFVADFGGYLDYYWAQVFWIFMI
jgi:hypothetical protein